MAIFVTHAATVILVCGAGDAFAARSAGPNANPQETGEDHPRPEAGTGGYIFRVTYRGRRVYIQT